MREAMCGARWVEVVEVDPGDTRHCAASHTLPQQRPFCVSKPPLLASPLNPHAPPIIRLLFAFVRITGPARPPFNRPPLSPPIAFTLSSFDIFLHSELFTCRYVTALAFQRHGWVAGAVGGRGGDELRGGAAGGEQGALREDRLRTRSPPPAASPRPLPRPPHPRTRQPLRQHHPRPAPARPCHAQDHLRFRPQSIPPCGRIFIQPSSCPSALGLDLGQEARPAAAHPAQAHLGALPKRGRLLHHPSIPLPPFARTSHETETNSSPWAPSIFSPTIDCGRGFSSVAHDMEP